MQVLITGAAGLIGRELCGVMGDRGHSVAALVRRDRDLARNDGSALPVLPWPGCWPASGQIAAVQGDVAEAGLGLLPEIAAVLARGADLIVHCAAVIGFRLEAAVYRRVNTGGVAQALAFAAASGRRIPLLHVSTAYVCGERTGSIAEEAAGDGPFANGYEASKAEGEALVLSAAERGHPVAIARPSIVVGAHSDGAIGGFGDVYQLLKLAAGGRLRVLPAEAGASLDLVPIDHVVGGLVDIAERMPGAAGKIFHLASGTPVPVRQFAVLAREFAPLNATRFVLPADYQTVRLSPREALLNQQVTSSYASYLRRDPRFITANLQALSGRTCPPTDHAFLRRLINHSVATGFITATTVQRTSGYSRPSP